MKIDREKMLQNKAVIEEINRHKWLESELVGYDIGFEKAAQDWFENYATSWVAYHDDKKRGKAKK